LNDASVYKRLRAKRDLFDSFRKGNAAALLDKVEKPPSSINIGETDLGQWTYSLIDIDYANKRIKCELQ